MCTSVNSTPFVKLSTGKSELSTGTVSFLTHFFGKFVYFSSFSRVFRGFFTCHLDTKNSITLCHRGLCVVTKNTIRMNPYYFFFFWLSPWSACCYQNDVKSGDNGDINFFLMSPAKNTLVQLPTRKNLLIFLRIFWKGRSTRFRRPPSWR